MGICSASAAATVEFTVSPILASVQTDTTEISYTPVALNNKGQILGDRYTQTHTEFLYSDSTTVVITDQQGQNQTIIPGLDVGMLTADGLNNAGKIVLTNHLVPKMGLSLGYVGDTKSGSLTMIPLPTELSYSTASSINQAGQVTGFVTVRKESNDHYSSTNYVYITDPANNQQMRLLTQIPTPLEIPNYINRWGQVAGIYINSNY